MVDRAVSASKPSSAARLAPTKVNDARLNRSAKLAAGACRRRREGTSDLEIGQIGMRIALTPDPDGFLIRPAKIDHRLG